MTICLDINSSNCPWKALMDQCLSLCLLVDLLRNMVPIEVPWYVKNQDKSHNIGEDLNDRISVKPFYKESSIE